MKKVLQSIIKVGEFIEGNSMTAFVELIIAVTLIIAMGLGFAKYPDKVVGVFCLLNLLVIGVPAMACCLYQMLGYNEEDEKAKRKEAMKK